MSFKNEWNAYVDMFEGCVEDICKLITNKDIDEDTFHEIETEVCMILSYYSIMLKNGKYSL